MTVRHLVAIAATAHSGAARVVYRNPAARTWTMLTPDPIAAEFGDHDALQVVDYTSGDHAMRALLHDNTYFNPADSWDIEQTDSLMRTCTVDVYQLPAEVGDDGTVVNVRDLLEYVSVASGQPMRPERALRELAAEPQPVGLGDADTPPSSDDALAEGSAAQAPAAGSPAVFPAIKFGAGRMYLPRTLFGLADVDFLRQLRQMGGHCRLSGPNGSGKSTLPAAAFGADVITVQGQPDLTAAGLCGQYLPRDGGWEWVDGPLTRAMREGKVLLVDELNRAPKDVDDVLLPAVDHRRQLVLADRPDLPPIDAADGFMVVATYNDVDSGIRPLSAALRRRLNMHVRVDTDYTIARTHGIDERLIRVAENLRTSGREFGRRHQCPPAWYPQMADLEGAHRMLAFGAQAAFTALTASTDDPSRLRDAAEAFAAVFGETVLAVAELGS